jgi:aminocarboxymuconate-semialdehyde decarboxylase
MEPAADGSAARVLFTGGPSGRGLTAQPVCWDPSARAEAMASRGVDAEVVTPMPGLLGYALSPSEGIELCRYINDFVVQLCAALPNRLYGLGLVPMQDPDLASRELALVKAAGLYGVEIATNVNGVSLGDDRFVDFFREAEAQDLALFVHGLAPTFADRYPSTAGAGFGVAAEVGIGTVSLAASGIFEKCPRLRIAISHGAGGYPLMLTREQFFWSRRWNEEPPDSPSGASPTETARKFYYDSLVFDRRALRYLVDMLGADRLLIGTDHPFMQREDPVGRTVRTLELPAEQLDAITWTNSFTWLGIPAPVPASATGAVHQRT